MTTIIGSIIIAAAGFLYLLLWLLGKFKKVPVWEYGTCNDRPARRNIKNGNVQFVLWKAGEQGHKEDYWHNFDSSWWSGFTPHLF